MTSAPYSVDGPQAIIRAGNVLNNPDGSLTPVPFGFYSQAGDDAVTITAALLLAAMRASSAYGPPPVRLMGTGYKVSSPVYWPNINGLTLEGTNPAAPNAGGTGTPNLTGSVLDVQPGWSAPAGQSFPGVVIIAGPASGSIKRPTIARVTINMTNAPNGMFGISVYGSVSFGAYEHILAYGQPNDNLGNDLLHWDKDGSGNFADGWRISNSHFQSYGRYGHYLNAHDVHFDHTHFQGAQASTTDGGCGYIINGEPSYDHCRFDQSLVGLIINGTPGASGFNNYILVDGCESENIGGPYIWCQNTSTTGKNLLTPVQVNGGGVYFCGRTAGMVFRCTGNSWLEVNGTDLSTNGGAFPTEGLLTETAGSGNGVPAYINIDGGTWNIAAAGSSPLPYINDTAPAALLRYRFYGVSGGAILPATVPALVKSATWP